jgi:hypothetical protein
MIDFSRSSFIWKHHPWVQDEYYKYTGGFVGQVGQVYHVRFRLEAKCEIIDHNSGVVAELYCGAPCRTEYTIARRNLFQIPSAEWRLAFSATDRIPLAHRPSWETEAAQRGPLSDVFSESRLDLRQQGGSRSLTDGHEIAQATLAGELMNARSSYVDAERKVTVTVEYPVNLININEEDGEFQVCTGPVILPDLATWDGEGVSRVFLAHVAITAFDHVEFILQRDVAAAVEERKWLDEPRGRDRYELRDPAVMPAGHPPGRPQPTVYNETWELAGTNVILSVPNP